MGILSFLKGMPINALDISDTLSKYLEEKGWSRDKTGVQAIDDQEHFSKEIEGGLLVILNNIGTYGVLQTTGVYESVSMRPELIPDKIQVPLNFYGGEIPPEYEGYRRMKNSNQNKVGAVFIEYCKSFVDLVDIHIETGLYKFKVPDNMKDAVELAKKVKSKAS